MGVVLVFLAVAAGYAAVMFVLMRLAVRARKRGIGASLMSGVDQVFHPIAYDSHLEIQVQEERMVPLTSPDDAEPGRRRWPRPEGDLRGTRAGRAGSRSVSDV